MESIDSEQKRSMTISLRKFGVVDSIDSEEDAKLG